MGIGTAIGLGISAVGSLLSGDEQRDAARDAQFRPFNVQGTSGGINFEGQNVNLTPAGTTADINNLLLRQALASGDANTDLARALQGAGGAGILPAFNQLQGFNALTPETALLAGQQFQGLFGQTAAAGSSALQEFTNAGNLAGVTGTALSNADRLLGAEGRSFNDLAAERLSALRAGARPAEERAVDSRLNNLFASGRLGTTGGQRAIESLALAQEQADIGRQVNAMDFAQNQSNFSQQLAQRDRGLGANLLGIGLQGRQADISRALQQGALGGRFLDQAGRFQTGILGAAGAFDESSISQAARRLQGAQGIFGFGQDILTADTDRLLQTLGGAQSIEQQLLDMARLGGSVGQAQASAGANAGALRQRAGSPFGAALQGLGTGIAESEGDFGAIGDFFGNIFGGD